MTVASPPPHVRIRPARGWLGLPWAELWEFRDVLLMLTLRDIKLRYKQTALGVAWVVLQPLLAGLLFALIFGRFLRLPSEGVPYLLFVFAGLTGWQLFAGIVQRASGSLVNEARLITKVYFPRILVPLAAAAAVLVDFAVSCGVMAVLLAVYDLRPGWEILLLVPAAGLTVVLGVGTSLWLAALSVRYRDFIHATPFLLQVWLYASPVVYAAAVIPAAWQAVFACNPMFGFIGLFRTAWLDAGAATGPALAIGGAVAVVVLLSGLMVFRRVEQEIADRL